MKDTGPGVTHASSHPSLPPAKPEQVVQFLLARNYHLTALELLVESSQFGHADEVSDLQQFFSDRFPPEEIARHAHSNTLDAQAASKEREQRLQLTEYELRLAKEDISELNRKLGDATRQLSEACISGQGAAPRSPAAKGQGAGVGPDAGGANHMSLTAPPGYASGVGEDLGEPSQADMAVLMQTIIAFLVGQGLRTSAITLREEAADVLGVSAIGAAGHHVRASESGISEAGAPAAGGAAAAPDSLTVWRWMRLAALAAPTNSKAARPHAPPHSPEPSTSASALAAAQASLVSTQQELAASRAATALASRQSGALTREVESLRGQLKEMAAKLAAGSSTGDGPKGQANGKEGAGGTPRHTGEPLGLLAAGRLDSHQSHQSSPGLGAVLGSVGGQSAGGRVCTIPSHAAHAHIVSQLTELLPRIMPALTIKSRLEVLPMVQAVILAAPDLETRRALVGLVFNGVATPDPSQRGAVVGLCARVAAALGPGWAAQEVLSMAVKQVASPSPERRVLVAEMIAALLHPAHYLSLAEESGQPGITGTGLHEHPPHTGPLVDVSTQAHALLTQLHRLAEDRMEQVREAAVGALVALLSPGCLSFSRAYFMTLSDALVQLLRDGSESVAAAALTSLLPALVHWAEDPSLITISLLPKVAADISRHMRAAAPLIDPAGAAAGQSQPGVTTQGGLPASQHSSTSSFQGSILSYSLAQGAAAEGGGSAAASGAPPDQEGASGPPPAQPAAGGEPPGATPPATGGGLGGSSSNNSLSGLSKSSGAGAGAALPPQAPAPGASQYNSRRFASYDLQAAHQLLGAYAALQPCVRAAALRSCPAWALAHAVKAAQDHARDQQRQQEEERQAQQQEQQAAGPEAAGGRHQSQGAVSDGATPPDSSAFQGAVHVAQAALANKTLDDSTLQPGSDARSGGSGATWSGGGGGAGRGGPSIQPSPAGTLIMHPSREGGCDFMRVDALLSAAKAAAAAGGVSAASAAALLVDAEEVVASGEVAAEDVLGAWGEAGAEQAPQWKTVLWAAQYLLPELVAAARLLPPPALPSPSSPLAGASLPPHVLVTGSSVSSTSGRAGAAGHRPGPGGAPPASSSGAGEAAGVAELRTDLAQALSALASALGPILTRDVVIPLLSVAAGAVSQPLPTAPAAAAGGQGSHSFALLVAGPLAPHVLELAADMQPSSAEALINARGRLLPLLVGAALPAAGPGALTQWLAALTHPSPAAAWATTCLPELSCAVCFAGLLQEGHVPEVLAVFEAQMHQQQSDAEHSSQGTTTANSNPWLPTNQASVSGGEQPAPATGHTGLTSVALLRGVLPLPATGPLVARRVMPPLMVLLSQGQPAVQASCVDCLLDVVLRFREDSQVVEQVFVVYDGLLQQGSHDNRCAVLYTGQRLAAVVAPYAARSAAAAGQLEWLLQAATTLAGQLLQAVQHTPAAAVNGAAQSSPLHSSTPDQQRAIAAALTAVVATVHAHDVRLPRLQSALHACAEILAHKSLRSLLSEQASLSVGAVLSGKPPPAGAPAAIAPPASIGAPALPQAAGGVAGAVSQRQLAGGGGPSPAPSPAPLGRLFGGHGTTEAQGTTHNTHPQARVGPFGSGLLATPSMQPPQGPTGQAAQGSGYAAGASQGVSAPGGSGLSSRFEKFKSRLLAGGSGSGAAAGKGGGAADAALAASLAAYQGAGPPGAGAAAAKGKEGAGISHKGFFSDDEDG